MSARTRESFIVDASAGPPGAWRLLLPALVGWAACALLITVPGSNWWITVAAGLAGSVCAVSNWTTSRKAGSRRPMGFRSAILLLCGVLIVLGVRVETAASVRNHPALVSALETGATVEFDADVVGFPKISSSFIGGESYGIAAAAHLDGARVPVMLWIDGPPSQTIGPGTHLQVRGKPAPGKPSSSTAWSISVRSLEVRSPASGWNAAASALRAGIVAAAASIPHAALVPGFAVGDTSLVSEELSADMLETGLTHLTAVSGANCALVVSAGIWFASHLGFGRRARIPIAGLMLLGFVGIVGPDSSVQRAAVMAAVVLISQFSGKRSQALSALGIAVLVLLIRDPWEAVQAGFALSVTATLGILLFSAPITRALRRTCRMPGWLATPFALSIAAQLTCGPLLLLLQSGLPVVSVFANVLAAPAAPAGTAFGLAATIMLPVIAWLGEWLLILASLSARWIELVAALGAEVPFGRWNWNGGWFGVGTLALVELLMVALFALRSGAISRSSWEKFSRRTPRRGRADVPRSAKRAAGWLGAVGGGIAITMTLVAPVASRFGVPNNWSIVSCDVGQGDATLLRDPTDPEFVMLIDTGDDEDLLRTCLDRFGVREIDQLVLTHDDRDHVGALDTVAPITQTAIIAPANAKDGTDRKLVRSLNESGVPFVELSEGATGGAATGDQGGLKWRVLAPARGTVPKDTNAASIVMSVQIQGWRILMLADTGKDEQKSMLAAGIDVTSDIVKIAHHGSKDQHLPLYEQSGAKAAFVSVGEKNSYGHPNADLLASLGELGMNAWRTDEMGTVALVLIGNEVRGFQARGVYAK